MIYHEITSSEIQIQLKNNPSKKELETIQKKKQANMKYFSKEIIILLKNSQKIFQFYFPVCEEEEYLQEWVEYSVSMIEKTLKLLPMSQNLDSNTSFPIGKENFEKLEAITKNGTTSQGYESRVVKEFHSFFEFLGPSKIKFKKLSKSFLDCDAKKIQESVKLFLKKGPIDLLNAGDSLNFGFSQLASKKQKRTLEEKSFEQKITQKIKDMLFPDPIILNSDTQKQNFIEKSEIVDGGGICEEEGDSQEHSQEYSPTITPRNFKILNELKCLTLIRNLNFLNEIKRREIEEKRSIRSPTQLLAENFDFGGNISNLFVELVGYFTKSKDPNSKNSPENEKSKSSPPKRGIHEYNDYLYLVLEDLDIDLKGFLKKFSAKLTFSQFKMIIFQIIFALAVLQEFWDFFHEDLHFKNVLLKYFQKKDMSFENFETEFEENKKTMFFSANGKTWRTQLPFMVKIIDFGNAVFREKTFHENQNARENHNIELKASDYEQVESFLTSKRKLRSARTKDEQKVEKNQNLKELFSNFTKLCSKNSTTQEDIPKNILSSSRKTRNRSRKQQSPQNASSFSSSPLFLPGDDLISISNELHSTRKSSTLKDFDKISYKAFKPMLNLNSRPIDVLNDQFFEDLKVNDFKNLKVMTPNDHIILFQEGYNFEYYKRMIPKHEEQEGQGNEKEQEGNGNEREEEENEEEEEQKEEEEDNGNETEEEEEEKEIEETEEEEEEITFNLDIPTAFQMPILDTEDDDFDDEIQFMPDVPKKIENNPEIEEKIENNEKNEENIEKNEEKIENKLEIEEDEEIIEEKIENYPEIDQDEEKIENNPEIEKNEENIDKIENNPEIEKNEEKIEKIENNPEIEEKIEENEERVEIKEKEEKIEEQIEENIQAKEKDELDQEEIEPPPQKKRKIDHSSSNLRTINEKGKEIIIIDDDDSDDDDNNDQFPSIDHIVID